MSLRWGSLFSGYAGLDLGVQSVLGGSTAWHAEIAPGPARILAHHSPDVPNLGDVSTVDYRAVEQVDGIAGGFPCTDVSHAGRRAGLIRTGDGRTRSGLWGEMLRAIDEIRPRIVIAENVRGLLSATTDSDLEWCPLCMGDRGNRPMRALGAVLGDLADLGYDAWWHGLNASDVGAPHERFRVFLVAYPAAPDPDDDLRRLLARGLADTQGRQRPGRTPDDGLARPGRPSRPRRTPLPDLDPWAEFAPAVARWGQILGRAPLPTEPLPVIAEWMMGLPEGHLTDVPGLSPSEAMKAAGNGVVPQQAAEAVSRFAAWRLAAP